MLRIGFALGLTLLLSAACGGGDDVKGIPPDKKMSELTAEEATSFCKMYDSDFEAIYGLPCTIQGLAQGDACATARDECLESAPSIDCDAIDTADLEDCDIPVSSVDECVTEFAGFARDVSCEEPPSSAITPPPCFNELRSRCKIFGG